MALGLAACLADVYAEVVLVETEPSRREPSIWPELDIPTRPGLGDYVEAGLNLEDVLRHTGRDNLYVLAAGASNAKSYVSLDAVSHMQKVLSQLRQRFAVVVVDLPPLLESEAAPILLECLDAAVLVIAAESTTTNDFNGTLALCGHLPIRGVLLNRERSRTPRWLQSLAIS
jgi:Mrp family chromosome partitioning ATPase